jgi:4-azaleucine resistance transporter AzlC
MARSYFWSGFRAGLPFLLVIGPYALLFGVIATEAGLDLLKVMSMSVLIIAGAAQFVSVQMMIDEAPLAVILLTALAVNMRMAMYSASMAPHIGQAPLWQRALAAYFLVDQSYGVSIQKYEEVPAMSLGEKLAFFFGAVAPVCPLWYVFTWIGAVAGTRIPPDYALDFAMPITFIAIFAPMLKSLAHVSAATVSVLGALALVWVPYNLGLILAGLAAMLTGALVETWKERRA